MEWKAAVGFFAEFAVFHDVGGVFVHCRSQPLIILDAEALFFDGFTVCEHRLPDAVHALSQHFVGGPFPARLQCGRSTVGIMRVLVRVNRCRKGYQPRCDACPETRQP